MLGLFEAGNWPCGIRTVRQVMPPKERSLGNALFQSGTALGAVITPYIVLICLFWADPASRPGMAHYALGGGPAAAAVRRAPGLLEAAVPGDRRRRLVWVVLWLSSVPGGRRRGRGAGPVANVPAGPFYRRLPDRRFWVLVVVIIGVNTTWHTFRVWLPLFLQKERGYTEAEMSRVHHPLLPAADVGSWTVGLTSLWLAAIGSASTPAG